MASLTTIDIAAMNEAYRQYIADPLTKKDTGSAFIEGYTEGNKGYLEARAERDAAQQSLHLTQKMVQVQDARIEVLSMAERMADEDALERIRRRDTLVEKMFNYAADNPESVDLTLSNLLVEYSDIVDAEGAEGGDGDGYVS